MPAIHRGICLCLRLYSSFFLGKKYCQSLKNNVLYKGALVVKGYNAGPSISAYLQRQLFYLDINQNGSFCYWKRSFFPARRATLQQQIALSNYVNHLDQFVLISNDPLAENWNEVISGNSVFKIRELQQFENSIVQSESYYVYLFRRFTGN